MAAQVIKPPTNYHFESVWSLNFGNEVVWQALTDPAQWPTWWPGLLTSEVATAGPSHIGGTSKLMWRAATGYKLYLTLMLTELRQPEFIAFEATGDLLGSGSCKIDSISQDRTRLTILWDVSTTKPWMNRYAAFLKPIFKINHAQLMSAGESGLKQYLAGNV